MRGIQRLVLSCLLLCLPFPGKALGCTISVEPVRQFDTSEYIFTGEVVQFVGPFTLSTGVGVVTGLLVRVKDVVYVPEPPADYYEVFLFELWSDCSVHGEPKAELEKYYPAGSKVKVVAKEAKLLPLDSKGTRTRLEVVPASNSSVSRNEYEDGRIMTSAQPIFDYKSYKKLTAADYAESFMPFLYAHRALPEFELRKDLLRLRNSSNQSKKVAILERLLYYPEYSKFDYATVVRGYMGKSKKANTLIKQWHTRGYNRFSQQ